MPPDAHAPPPGRVTLVGAGPGDPDLLTVRALKAIERAEALLFDALVSEEIVALAPERCVKIGVGKRGDRMSVPQAKTNALMARPRQWASDFSLLDCSCTIIPESRREG